jgi:hypothetical protein
VNLNQHLIMEGAMGFQKRFRQVCTGLGLALLASSWLHAEVNTPPPRPSVTSLVIQLDNGQTYALSQTELQDEKAGMIAWNDWTVNNLLIPHYLFSPQGVGVDSAIRAWYLPGPSGQLPGFLIKTENGLVNPLDPGVPGSDNYVFNPHRPVVVSIVVGIEDGRTYSLTQVDLYEQKSGSLIWKDGAVNAVLVPFYCRATGLPTSPADVLKLWGTGVPFLLKPWCLPWGP